MQIQNEKLEEDNALLNNLQVREDANARMLRVKSSQLFDDMEKDKLPKDEESEDDPYTPFRI